MFRCGDGLCIPVSWTCDQQDDCHAGDDENPKLCGKEEECNEFTCSTGACIPHRLVLAIVRTYVAVLSQSEHNTHCLYPGGCVTVGWTAQMDLMKEITVARRGMEQTRVTWTKAGTLARMDHDASKPNMFATPPLNVEMEVTRACYAPRSLTAPLRHVRTSA